MSNLRVGTVNWFGGLNSKTGKVNDFGFVHSRGDDVFVHRTQVISDADRLAPDVSVIFRLARGKGERPAAQSVRIISAIPDDEIGSLLEAVRTSPEEVLRLLLSRTSLAEWYDEVVAVLQLPDVQHNFWLLKELCDRLAITGINDPILSLVPESIRLQLIRRHYGRIRELLTTLVSATGDAISSVNASTLYARITEPDQDIARRWSGEGRPAVYAKMLSARVAEIAAKEIYERAGHSVEDVSIHQLGAISNDWLTHDLLLDESISVDVKNSRRPISSKNFYVEHTVPKFKLDRRNSHVRIAALLSPYVKHSLSDKPFDKYFPNEDIVFLGETSVHELDRLSKTFDTPNFSVPRTSDRVFPNWVFSYPASWYGSFNKLIEAADAVDWPSDEDWESAFSDLPKATVIQAFCILQNTLPAPISDEMWDWQVRLHHRLRSVIGAPPNLPAIFLTILTDFLSALSEDRENYAPKDCEQLLFIDGRARFPLGAIDPLQLVSNLLKTLQTLWDGRGETRLARFKQFRFVGLGILQGRESQERPWTTIIAYCGGVQYETDKDGHIEFREGVATPKGKCGHTPLIIGHSRTCPSCRKLICSKCSFCSQPCRDQSLVEAASQEMERIRLRREQHEVRWASQSSPPPEWDEVPLGAYEDSRRWERIR
ncbi:cold shock domain-containing protein [Brevundimonas sp. WCHBH090558]|uniref:cold-shock protein n=1 Tax=Brevundimonas huaxiensis TaxID=2725493 RepID=UPI0016266C1D|nr:cold shock domain-containing protein [Brevundimonas huaxiensis]MBC1182258.1 cold shock domain-containing protein [Brevundimonas huaxiensis]